MKPAALLAGVLAMAPVLASQTPPVPEKSASHGLTRSDADSGFVGSETCRSCHSSTHATWTAGRHSRMLQPAHTASVIPAFDHSVTLHGKEYRLTRDGNDYFIIEAYLQSTPTRRRVDYTLGSRRVQHYLSRLEDGRIVVLPPSYDVEKKEWFHNLDVVDLEESGAVKVQVWNSNCFGCHASGEEKRFDPASKTFSTTWTDFGTGCERCHGPGRSHAARYSNQNVGNADREGVMVLPKLLEPETSVSVCAQCHALRDITQPGFTAGSNYYDYFTPLLEYAQKRNHDPAYWPNGRPRRFSNEAMAFWESQCSFKGGATCLSCHSDVHEPNIEKNSRVAEKKDSLCVGCHQAIAAAGSRHTRHGETPAAASAGPPGATREVGCVSCHMPETVISLRHRMPDHTISIPNPVNTARFGIPNACNECHKDQSPEWAESTLAAWFPNGRRQQSTDDAIAFSLGAKKDPAAVVLLAKIAADTGRPPLFRANALGHLRHFSEKASTTALLRASRETHPAIRLAAALSLTERVKNPDVLRVMEAGLGDARRTIRMASALGVLSAGLAAPSARPDLLRSAMDDHAARARFLSEDADSQMDLGKMFFLARDWTSAERAMRDALQLNPGFPGGHYFLGLATLGQGRLAESQDLLRAVAPTDPHRKDAEAVLAKLSAMWPPVAPRP